MKRKDLLSKRYLYAFFLFTLFLYTPNLLEGFIASNVNTDMTNNEFNVINYSIKTSPLQAISYDASVPYVNENESNVIIDGVVSEGEYADSYKSDHDIVAYWEHNDENLTIALVTPGKGFIAMGLGTSGMVGADMKIGGWFDNNNTAYCFDATGSHWISAPYVIKDTSFDVIEFSASQNNDGTTFEFKIPMNSSDSLDKPMETNNTINFFFAYHFTSDNIFDETLGNYGHNASMPNTYIKKLFFKIPLQPIDTQMSFSFPLKVNQGDNFTLGVELKDEDLNPIPNMTIEFFRKTEFGILTIGEVKTDSNGKAILYYSSTVLTGNITIGANFKEYIGKSGPIDFYYKSKILSADVNFLYTPDLQDEVRDIFFIPLQSDIQGGVFYLLLLRDFLFYLALLSIWGVYAYNTVTILTLRFIKDKKSSKTEKGFVLEEN